MKIYLSPKLDSCQWEGYASLLSVIPISMVQYSPSPLWSTHLYMLCSIPPTIIDIIISIMFDIILFLLSILFYMIRSIQLCPLWSDMILFNPIKYDLICSLLFDPLTPIFSDTLYSDQYNPIQSDRSLFPALLSPLRSLELLIFLKITYH